MLRCVSAFPRPGSGLGTSAQVHRNTARDQRLEELRLFAEGNGGVAHVSRTDPDRPELGEWCHTQAR